MSPGLGTAGTEKTNQDPTVGPFGSGPLVRGPSSVSDMGSGEADIPASVYGWTVPRRPEHDCWPVPIGRIGQAKQRTSLLVRKALEVPQEEMLPWGLSLLPRKIK